LKTLLSGSDYTVSEILDAGLTFFVDALDNRESASDSIQIKQPRTVTRAIVVEPGTLRRLDMVSKQLGLSRSELCELCLRLHVVLFEMNVSKLSQILPKFSSIRTEIVNLISEVEAMGSRDEETLVDYLGMSELYLDMGINAIKEAIEQKSLVKNNI
jgi:hypothetical protein